MTTMGRGNREGTAAEKRKLGVALDGGAQSSPIVPLSAVINSSLQYEMSLCDAKKCRNEVWRWALASQGVGQKLHPTSTPVCQRWTHRYRYMCGYVQKHIVECPKVSKY